MPQMGKSRGGTGIDPGKEANLQCFATVLIKKGEVLAIFWHFWARKMSA